MAQPYCYWTVADGRYAAMMERCVKSARGAGVFKDFHVFTDTPIEGCECYDCQSVAGTHEMYKLVYLKAGMSKLLFDYFVWIDADTLFRKNPWGMLSVLGKSPVHVPLVPFSRPHQPDNKGPTGASSYAELLTKAGVYNPPYDCNAAFWIIRRDAIDRVHDLALHFLGFAKKEGHTATQDEALGYAMQMLCADPSKHMLKSHAEIWGQSKDGDNGQDAIVGSAILHLGRERRSLFDSQAIEMTEAR